MVKSLPYDTLTGFTAVTSVAKAPYVLVASTNSGVNSLADLKALAKRSPQDLTFGNGEAGMRFAAERLGGVLGAPVTHVSYKGTGPMMTDLAGGHLRFSMTSIASAMPFRNSASVNFIAVTGASRMPVLANIPTLAEQGVTGFDASIWYGLVAPPGMPKLLASQIAASVRSVMGTEEVKKRLTTLAMEPWLIAGEEFDGFMREDLAANLKLAKQSGIEPQ
ncbi:MAG: tripartite tricarboxylate transporter substrate binding protein [Betaproteobacteria bacterium]|nr:tripartite tricarboxylate transporter substrate binding protein [Betaproteobacteria bacterium]